MSKFILERSQAVPRPLEEVFRFFADAYNLEAITPSFLHFRILTPDPIVMGVGTIIDYKLHLYSLPQPWRTRIVEWEPPNRFVDAQVLGPYRSLRHSHAFRSQDHRTLMLDRVEYDLPYGPFGWIAHALVVRRTLARIFDYRRDRIAVLLGSEPHGTANR